MNYNRQLEVFDPQTFNTPITIVGAGAAGSWVALQLAKLGCSDITVYDFDKVEEHNLPNQAFRAHVITCAEGGMKTDIGRNKVTALQDIVYDFANIAVVAKNERVSGAQKLRGIVFMLTDTMSSRKEIYEKAIKMKPHVELLIETRMGLYGGRIYTVDPKDLKQCTEYEKTLYADDEAVVSACGTSQSIVATANLIASMAVWQLLKWHKTQLGDTSMPLENEIMFYPAYGNYITNVW